MGIEGDVFLEQSNGTKSGHYERDLTAKYGHIDILKVPMDGEGTFMTQIFQPDKRFTGIEGFMKPCMRRASMQGRLREYWSSCSTTATPVPQSQGQPMSLSRTSTSSMAGH